MANFDILKAQIAQLIPDNTEQAITAQDVRDSFDATIDAINAAKEDEGAIAPAQWGGITGDLEDQTDLKNALDAKQDTISDLATIQSGAAAGATAVQPGDLALVASTGDYDDLLDKPTIPAEIDTVNVTVDNNTGVPSATGSVSGSTLTLAFSNLKGATGAPGATGATGATGPQGPQGPQGNPGSSVDYPFTLANNLTTDDSTVALSAAMGVQLEGEISQLEQEVFGINEEVYINAGQVAYYKGLGTGTSLAGMGVYTPALSENKKVNKITFPPFRCDTSNVAAKYFICYGTITGSPITPNTLNHIADGIINNVGTTLIEDYTIELETPVTVPAGNGVYVLIYAQSGTIIILGGGNASTANLPYNSQDAAAYMLAANNYTSPFDKSWSKASTGATARYFCCNPILKFEEVGALSEIEGDIIELQNEQAQLYDRNKIEINLPEKINAVVGDNIQLFYRGFVSAVNPYNYDILITCSKGKQYPRYWAYKPVVADVGDYSFRVQVKDNNGNVLGEKSSLISVVSKPTAPLTPLNIVIFGDSLTEPGVWPAEAYRRLTGTLGSPVGDSLQNINFCGRMNKGGAGYCGIGGWNINSYVTNHSTAIRFYVSGVVVEPSYGSVYSNNGKNFTIREVNITAGTGSILCALSNSADRPTESGELTKVSGSGDSVIQFSSYIEDVSNPLWDVENNKFSFVPYANAYCNGQIDVVYTLLSWNGLEPWKNAWDSWLPQMETFANTLHTEFPSAIWVMMGVQVPILLGSMAYPDSFGMLKTVFNMNSFYESFASEHSEFVKFVNVSTQFDTDNGLPKTFMLVNDRAYPKYSTTETYHLGDTVMKTISENGVLVNRAWICKANDATGDWDESKWEQAPELVYETYCVNAVHPSYNGYLQIADVAYRSIVAEFCQ